MMGGAAVFAAIEGVGAACAAALSEEPLAATLFSNKTRQGYAPRSTLKSAGFFFSGC